MMSSNLLIAVALAYVIVLFTVAALADRQVARGQFGWLTSPMVYTLSLSVYCTAWTFYGAVGSAARNGLEFAAIYIGPTLLFLGWFWILRKLVRIGRTQRITSVADLIASRYGKSNALAVVVTLLAVVSSTPYIALQIQSLTISFATLNEANGHPSPSPGTTAFYMALGLALFTILFGTRHVDANERHHGVVTAIALEAIVKLVALLAVGGFVVFGIYGGAMSTFANAPENFLQTERLSGSRWIALNGLAAMAIIALPRMFHVLVVENVDERHLATAAWAFPLYLFLISLFVAPIAIAGLDLFPETANSDMFVLTVPLEKGQTGLALLAFLGGLSAATSMIIVSAIALSTMVSNHLVVPLWLALRRDGNQLSGDIRKVLLASRRVSIIAILTLGLLYFNLTGGTESLARIGLIAFAGMAQIIPTLLGGIYWRGATRFGAMAGLICGAAIWAYTLLLPSFGGALLISADTIANGAFGLSALKPEALLGLHFEDKLVHSLFWSLGVNGAAFICVSLLSTPNELERLQSALFVDAFRGRVESTPVRIGRSATGEDLFTLAQRILGGDQAYAMFAKAARDQGKTTGLPNPTDQFIRDLEQELAGSVGSSSAHAMVSQIAGGGTISVDDLMNIADETAQILEYSQRLETQSHELEESARKLRAANAQLQELGAQKDAFLSQVSHELRTPMTSIRSFAEILNDMPDLDSDDAHRFIGIIGQESLRLTRLLDEILDLSFLESGAINWTIEPVSIAATIERAIQTTTSDHEIQIQLDEEIRAVQVKGDFDRITQVFINLISNVQKYGHRETPVISITSAAEGDRVHVDFHDNGPGIPIEQEGRVFQKFTRLSSDKLAGSAGLGLSISREILRNLGGDLSLLPSDTGTTFRATFLRIEKDS